jgi:hypothetical protein
MRLHLTALCLAALFTGVLVCAQTQPTQPVDPTQHAPATPPQSTPPTFPPSAKQPPDEQQPNTAETAQGKDRTFMGTITLRDGAYVLRSGDKEYKLDDQSKAKEYAEKDVKILGRLDKQQNVIHVQDIQPNPSM